MNCSLTRSRHVLRHTVACLSTTLLLSAAPVLPYSLEWDKSDPFHQPAPTTDYYGSGDIDLDGDVDVSDRNAAQAMVNAPSSNPPTYRADVNGDGAVTSSDITEYDTYLEWPEGSYLPGWWNSLFSRQERIDWLTKMVAIYKSNYRQGDISPWYVSEDFAEQFVLLCTHERRDRSVTEGSRRSWEIGRAHV
jgi:hypothetical protein